MNELNLLSGGTAAGPRPEWPLPKARLWFVFFTAWMTALAVVAQATFMQYEAGDLLAMRVWLLALMCFYLSLCNVLLPLPTAWIVLLAASEELMVFDAAWLRVAGVAVLGAVATAVANLNEYHVLAYLFKFGLGRRVRRTRVYRWAVHWFELSPFRTLVLMAFLPIPIDAVRWLAVLRRYSRVRYGLAYLIGRTPRYALLAGLSVAAQLTTWQIIIIQVAIVLILAARLSWSALLSLRKGSGEARGAAEVELKEGDDVSAPSTP
ncbi:MAG: hypothetical protein KKB50_04730 [Planctomycetes bacterium]|nr:hypothetical protein [Planctomycetota bacterium]